MVADNQRVTKKMQKTFLKIWSCQKKAVPLHPLSLKTKHLVFERLSIQDVVQEQETIYNIYIVYCNKKFPLIKYTINRIWIYGRYEDRGIQCTHNS